MGTKEWVCVELQPKRFFFNYFFKFTFNWGLHFFFLHFLPAWLPWRLCLTRQIFTNWRYYVKLNRSVRGNEWIQGQCRQSGGFGSQWPRAARAGCGRPRLSETTKNWKWRHLNFRLVENQFNQGKMTIIFQNKI